MKENKYDDPAFFDAYGKMERSVRGLEAAGEWPALRSLFPHFEGKKVLDLGCGYGWHCRYAAERGATVLGTDISEKMIAEAKKRNLMPGIAYRQQPVEDLSAGPGSFDVVISSLVMHYVQDYASVCEKIYDLLNAGGSFVFSVEHPVFTAEGSQQWITDDSGRARYWPVDHYYAEGARQTDFLGSKVVKYHRTLTSYLETLFRLGFILKHVIEPQPDPVLVAQHPGYKNELRRPMMLLIRADKPAAN
ncbi:SAM-dependent methyltransferase [Pedobacter yulinensis]|uniref:SAM-dependent methyltransferase n=1 Tax=Pedobacter yulinensis TaxID=2126353 RepID=A0A2T3HPE3_9SPHI|nr:class I SAM-dependent methyltransferase [Pedobacter yulinensis]PST84312.1 SAM-dependent methyltransferase [Pedobacter yulinensis]